MMADLLQVIYVLVYHLSILKQNTVFKISQSLLIYLTSDLCCSHQLPIITCSQLYN